MQIKVALTGPNSGKTVFVNGKQFVNGFSTVSFTTPSEREFQLRYLERVCRAFPVGSPALLQAQEQDKSRGIQCPISETSNSTGDDSKSLLGVGPSSAGGVPEVPANARIADVSSGASDGDEGMVSEWRGPADSGVRSEQIGKVRKAVRALDPLVESNWTQGGLPTVEAICTAIQDKGVTRAMIQAVEPEFTREVALQLAAESEI